MSDRNRVRGVGAVLALAVLVPGSVGITAAAELDCDAACQADLERARAATERYWDSTVAAREGFTEVGECVSTPTGSQAILWAHPARTGDQTVAVEEPEGVLYVSEGLGGRRLVGLEYSTPVADGAPVPELFGRRFGSPEAARAAGMPTQHVLRVWLFADNPSGLFADANPAEACGRDELVDWHARAERCLEVSGVIPVRGEAVRAHLPDGFQVEPGSEPGTVQVFVGTHHCERGEFVDGTVAEPVMFGYYSPNLKPHDYVGVDFVSSRYLFRFFFDDAALTDAFQRGMGIGPDVMVHAPDIEREFDAAAGLVDTAYRFSTPDFVLDAVMIDPPESYSCCANVRFMRETSAGLAKFRVWVRFSPLTWGVVTVTPKPGSLLAEITGCPAQAASCDPIAADYPIVARLETAVRLTDR